MKIIYETAEGGVAIITPAPGKDIDAVAAKRVPDGTAFEKVEDSVFPVDRIFRNAWVKTEATVVEDLTKSKVLGHDMRRNKRAEEFKPHDDLISKQIPGADNDAAEASRATIRTKYATMQTSIDEATTTELIKTALKG